MADDWEALADDPVAIPSLDVKESWEDEEDEALKELEKEKQLKAKLAEMPKPIKEDKPKPAPKKVVKLDRDENRALTPEEKAARLEMEKKSDYENARDLFGGIDDNSAKGERVALDDKTFDDFKPKSERDFDDFATFLAGKVAPFEQEYFYRHFVRTLLKKITENLTPEDMKDISKTLDTLINEKLKKQSNKKKKPTATKAVKRELDSEDEEEDAGGLGDEYDGFM